MDLIDSLDRTFRHARGVIAGVRAEQHPDRTPCAEWTVHDLLEHMIGVVAGMGPSAAGMAVGQFSLSDDPAAQFEAAAAASLAAWRTPGLFDGPAGDGSGGMPPAVGAGINLIDTATHTWDLAKATGQSAALPDEVADAAMEASLATIVGDIRIGRFGPELTAPAGAGPTERLVAFLGRRP